MLSIVSVLKLSCMAYQCRMLHCLHAVLHACLNASHLMHLLLPWQMSFDLRLSMLQGSSTELLTPVSVLPVPLCMPAAVSMMCQTLAHIGQHA